MTFSIKKSLIIYRSKGLDDNHARGQIFQDIVLLKISKAGLKDKISIKGGVVMLNKTKNVRRSTIDLDIDFIKMSISEASIHQFCKTLSLTDDKVKVEIVSIKELDQQDYKGERLIINLIDLDNVRINNAKIDIGVHTKLSIVQDQLVFNIDSTGDTIKLLANTNEQIIGEKICSLIKHTIASTRFKDIYDIYFLIKNKDTSSVKLADFFNSVLPVGKAKDINDVCDIVEKVLSDDSFSKEASKIDYNWTDVEYQQVKKTIIDYLYNLYV